MPVQLLKHHARPLSLLLLLGHVLLSGCSGVDRGETQTPAAVPSPSSRAASVPCADAERDERGAIWKFFHPDYLEGVPTWGKVLYWAGPGH